MPHTYGRQEEDDGVRAPGGLFMVATMLIGTILLVAGTCQLFTWGKMVIEWMAK